MPCSSVCPLDDEAWGGGSHSLDSTRYRGELHHDTPRLKEVDEEDPRQEAAHVRPPRDAAPGGAQGDESSDRLSQEPEPEHQPRGKLRQLEEESERHERDDPCARKPDEVGAEHARDRSA